MDALETVTQYSLFSNDSKMAEVFTLHGNNALSCTSDIDNGTAIAPVRKRAPNPSL